MALPVEPISIAGTPGQLHLIGRPVTGAAMDALGEPGLGWTLALFYGAATLAALLALRRTG